MIMMISRFVVLDTKEYDVPEYLPLSRDRFQVFLEMMVPIKAPQEEKKIKFPRKAKARFSLKGPAEALACYNRSLKYCHRRYQPLAESQTTRAPHFGDHWHMNQEFLDEDTTKTPSKQRSPPPSRLGQKARKRQKIKKVRSRQFTG